MDSRPSETFLLHFCAFQNEFENFSEGIFDFFLVAVGRSAESPWGESKIPVWISRSQIGSRNWILIKIKIFTPLVKWIPDLRRRFYCISVRFRMSLKTSRKGFSIFFSWQSVGLPKVHGVRAKSQPGFGLSLDLRLALRDSDFDKNRDFQSLSKMGSRPSRMFLLHFCAFQDEFENFSEGIFDFCLVAVGRSAESPWVRAKSQPGFGLKPRSQIGFERLRFWQKSRFSIP
jgi:hypothetical protein